jgi:hypothetical protein
MQTLCVILEQFGDFGSAHLYSRYSRKICINTRLYIYTHTRDLPFHSFGRPAASFSLLCWCLITNMLSGLLHCKVLNKPKKTQKHVHEQKLDEISYSRPVRAPRSPDANEIL